MNMGRIPYISSMQYLQTNSLTGETTMRPRMGRSQFISLLDDDFPPTIPPPFGEFLCQFHGYSSVTRGPVRVEVPPPPSNSTLVIGAAGIALMHSFEGCEKKMSDGRFEAYPDPGSVDGNPWTIGWGSTGPGIRQGTIWTLAQCDARFLEDMKKYSDTVISAIGDAPTTQNQFDALVSFHYNTGAIRTATLTKLHKAGKYLRAQGEFAKWNKNDGKVMRGLTRRRTAEAELYATP
jgi:lysozyme